jgi:hypothetical protein
VTTTTTPERGEPSFLVFDPVVDELQEFLSQEDRG